MTQVISINKKDTINFLNDFQKQDIVFDIDKLKNVTANNAINFFS